MTYERMMKLVQENYDDVLTACTEAARDAYDNPHLRFVVCMDEDGDIDVLQDVAGGNSMFMWIWEGEGFEIAEFCEQCFDPEYDDDVIRETAERLGYKNFIEEAATDAEAGNMFLETAMYDVDDHVASLIMQEVYRVQMEWYKDEYAREEAEQRIEYFIQNCRAGLELEKETLRMYE